MKVLIVAKTRQGGGACIGGITFDGRSVRLIAADAATNERPGLEYEVGEVWEIDGAPPAQSPLAEPLRAAGFVPGGSGFIKRTTYRDEEPLRARG